MKKSIGKKYTIQKGQRGRGENTMFVLSKISLCSHVFPFTHGSWIHEGV
jgi:hypothetical protein